VPSVRIGLVGAGEQGAGFLFPALMQVSGATLVGIADSIPGRAEALASRTGAPAFASAEALIDACAPDALVIACAPQVQIQLAHLAIARGIHVFVEKPPALYLSELRLLADMARRRGVVTGVGMNFRFSSAALAIQQAIASPDFGELVHLTLSYAANKPKAPMWDLDSSFRTFLLAQSIHAIDLALALGGPVTTSSTDVVMRDGAFAFARHSLKFASGGLGTILAGNVFPRFDFHVTAVGDASQVVSSNSLWSVDVLAAGEPLGTIRKGENQWRPSPLESGYGRTGYLQELKTFVEAVTAGHLFSGGFESLIPVFEIIEAALDSQELRRVSA